MFNAIGKMGMSMGVLFSALVLASCGGADVERDTREGTVIGHVKDHNDTESLEFLGIPYAKPPVGDLRFAPPQNPESFPDGRLLADEYGAVCPQQLINSKVFRLTGSEDCLFLNLWAPVDASAGDAKPVMVFVHGGANKFGSGDQRIRDFVSMLSFNIPGTENISLLSLLNIDFIETPIFNGHYLASNEDLVVISINYRMGPLGAMYKPELGPGAGNYTYLDIKKSLEWVQDNVAGFGGDPDNVTLFGESAGAWNSCALMNMPEAEGLFDKVIMESQTCMYQTAEQASMYADYFAAAAGCGDTDDVAGCLRTQPLDAFFRAGEGDAPVGGTPFLPVAGTPEMPEAFQDAVQGAAFNHVPIIIGNNDDEILVASASDPVFNCPLEKNLQIFADHLQAPVYQYRFDHNPGAFFVPSLHTVELPYVFGTAIDMFGASKREAAVVEQVTGYWANFARNSNPNGRGLAYWPEYTESERPYMRLKRDSELDYGTIVADQESCLDHTPVDQSVGLHGHFW